MEHIVQFGVNIDDEKIVKTTEAKIEKIINEVVKADIYEALTSIREYNKYEYSKHLMILVNNTMEKFCVENKEEIIKLAANRLAEKLSRTKVAKEAIEKVLKEMESKQGER